MSEMCGPLQNGLWYKKEQLEGHIWEHSRADWEVKESGTKEKGQDSLLAADFLFCEIFSWDLGFQA